MKLSFSFVYMCVVSSNPAFYTKNSNNNNFGPGNQLRCRKEEKATAQGPNWERLF